MLQSGTNLDTQKWEKNDGGNCRAGLPKEAWLDPEINDQDRASRSKFRKKEQKH